MNRSLIAFYVGSIAFVLYGVGHSLGYASGRAEDREKEFVKVLRSTPAEMPGVSKSRFDLYEGYSWMTGLMPLAFGLLNLVLVRVAPQLVVSSRPLLAVNLLVALAVALMAWRFFFAPPLSLAALAALAFLLGLVWAGG
ncbi:MAG TPA: hypothetical protein VF017_01145 [Thermoanaerobaculia bacterium]|nr:hypothetical protein [Thermoanaerobaculia bacterium]